MGWERIWISWFESYPWNPMVFVDFMVFVDKMVNMDNMVGFGFRENGLVWFGYENSHQVPSLDVTDAIFVALCFSHTLSKRQNLF